MWSYREMLRETPQTFWLMVGCVPLGVFLEWAGIQLPALVVEQVTTGQTFAHAAGGRAARFSDGGAAERDADVSLSGEHGAVSKGHALPLSEV